MRIATMTKQLLDEVHSQPLDTAGLERLRTIDCGSPEIVEGFLCRFRLGVGFPDLVVDG
jgi:hypothetical protein